MIKAALQQIEAFLVADRTVLSVILLNALLVFAMGFDLTRSDPTLEVVDGAFTTYFVFEAALKIRRAGLAGYFASSWNRFDFALVALSLPSYALLIVDIPDLSFVFVLRLARVARFFRFIRFIPDIGQLLDGVRRALRASLFVALAFFVFTFVISLLSCHLFHRYAPEHFANPMISFYSTFRVFTIEGWYEIPDAIVGSAPAAMGVFARAYFMACTLGGGILGLSLLNAIFVDEMLRNETDLVERRLDELHQKLDALRSELRSGSPHEARPEDDN